MNDQAISILAEKGLTGEKPTVDHKLSMNHHCLARKEKKIQYMCTRMKSAKHRNYLYLTIGGDSQSTLSTSGE